MICQRKYALDLLKETGNVKRTLKDLLAFHKPPLVALTEKKLSGDDAEHAMSEFHFSGKMKVDAEGFGGRIWLIWNDFKMGVDPLATTRQEIHAMIKVNPNSPPWCSFQTLF